MKKILIIGGGLGGLTTAILLARSGFQVFLYEKKTYPFHRVCGEYISNEVLPFLQQNDLFPKKETSKITQFEYGATDGSSHKMPLDLGAFGISRFYFDHYLAELAIEAGVDLRTGKSIVNVFLSDGKYSAEDNFGNELIIDLVIGAFGKNSNLDRSLDRDFLKKDSPYIGVKYHIKTDFPKDLIALYNFQSGYCGVSAIEDDRFNMCYLGDRSILKAHGDIPSMEKAVLYKNPKLKALFENSDFIFEKPVVINAFNFSPKKPVENGIFMVGDAAGLITPLCGNGMAMAIHSGKLLSDLIIHSPNASLAVLAKKYTSIWSSHFAQRLWVGRQTQKLFGSGKSSTFALKLMRKSPRIARQIMKNTHGQPF